jgi:hypothetical protein
MLGTDPYPGAGDDQESGEQDSDGESLGRC